MKHDIELVIDWDIDTDFVSRESVVKKVIKTYLQAYYPVICDYPMVLDMGLSQKDLQPHHVLPFLEVGAFQSILYWLNNLISQLQNTVDCPVILKEYFTEKELIEVLIYKIEIDPLFMMMWVRHQLGADNEKLSELWFKDKAKLNIITKARSKGGNKKNKVYKEPKKWAISEWKKNDGSYTSKADFARYAVNEILKKYALPVTSRAIEGWLKEY